MHPERLSIVRFFLISLCLHLVFLLTWSNSPKLEQKPIPIPVSFVLLPERKEVIKKEKKVTPAQDSRLSKRTTPPRRTLPRTKRVTPKSTPLAAKKPALPKGFRFQPEKPKEPSRPKSKEQTIVQRPLPSLKELLPPVAMTPSRDGTDLNEEVVRLDSTDPNYVSYLSSIKRDIELVWEYPPPALRQGVQGRLVVEFRIKQNGRLMGAKLVHSSGYPILDEEAIRAIQAAAPFHPIPRWIGKERLAISASFEYYDNRLKYSYTP